MNREKKFSFTIVLYIILPITLFAVLEIPFIFYNNDDLFLKQIASGELTGTPETHLLHIGYLTGVFLSVLYKLFPAIPWYGILLFSYGYLSITLALYAVSLRIEKKLTRVLFSVFFILIVFSFSLIHLINIQYTTITAIVSAAWLVFFYLSEDNEDTKKYLTGNMVSLILFFLALELRNKACVMFLPTYFLLLIIKWIKNKKIYKSLLSYSGILLLLLMLSFGIEKIAYSSNHWNDFRTYNTSRENIIDYEGFPIYEEYKEDYERLGITYQSYVSATSHYQLLLDEHIDANFMQKMDDLSGQSKIDIKAVLKNYIERHTLSYMDRPLNLIVYVLYFFAVLFIFISKKYKILWDISALFCGRNIIWFYLLWIGRCPTRITQGIYMVELLLLLAIIVSNKLYYVFPTNKKAIRHLICGTFIACSLVVAIKWGIPNITIITDYSRNHLASSHTYQEVREYLYENEDNLYLLDTMSFSYFTENIFSKTPASSNNFVSLGGWTANSPWTDSILAQYGYSTYEQAAVTGNNVYFIFMNNEQTDYAYLNDYFEEKHPGSSLIVTDTIHCTSGLEFSVLQLQLN